MVVLRAWYDPDDDAEPIVVASTADADLLLARMAADREAMTVPPLLQLSRRDPDGWAVLQVGVNGDHGVLTLTDATGSLVTTDGTARPHHVFTYDYMGSVREIPGNAEVPIAAVRGAVHEFVTSTARPTSVNWQVQPAGVASA